MQEVMEVVAEESANIRDSRIAELPRNQARGRIGVYLGRNVTSVTTDGSFAIAIAQHPAIPEHIIKVVHKDDPGADFALHVFTGTFNGTTAEAHVPRITSYSEVGEIAVIVMERLRPYIPNRSTKDAYSKAFSAVRYNDEWEQNCGNKGYADDSHSGNIMYRADGTLVVIDPVWLPG